MRFPVFAWRLVLLVTALTAVVVVNPQADTWWNLRAGHQIWQTGSVPTTEEWSFTAAGRWWPNHEWAWQAIAWPAYHLGGMALLTLISAVAAIGVVLLSGPGRRPVRSDVVVAIAAIAMMSSAWSVRPQLTSMLCFAVLLHLLRRDLMWPVPLVMLAWANLHGAVILGGVALVAACVAAVGDRARLRRLLLVTALSAVATLATPLGWRLWLFVIESFGRSKTNRVMEWTSAFNPTWFTLAFWAWLLAFAGIVWMRRARLGDWPTRVSVAVAIAMAPLAMTAVRNIAFFVIAAMTALFLLLGPERADLADRADRDEDTSTDTVPGARAILVIVAAVVVLLAGATLATNRPSWHPVPEATIAAARACPGQVYTSYESGAYLLWWAPDVPVFVDNRQDPYPAAILELGALDAASDYEPTFTRYDVRCAAVLSSDASTVERLESDGWQRVQDGSGWVVLHAPTSADR